MTTHSSFTPRSEGPSHGLILAGTQSGSGKTAIASLLLAAFAERGIPTQPFKVGPDFIDPAYHATYATSCCRNLDTWLMGVNEVQEEVRCHGAGKIGLVEGVMGLFDGGLADSADGSTLELAQLLGWPILLILPSAKAGRSLAATLRGFLEEAGPGRITGVILNQVSGDSHRTYLCEALAPLKTPILGALPQLDALHWPERHLGLQAARESALPSRKEMAAIAESHLDIGTILTHLQPSPTSPTPLVAKPIPHKRVAIARDDAFHFYYASNLDYLRENGLEPVEFSPLHDQKLPSDISGLIFGGGFPEIFGAALAENNAMRREVKSVLENGLPCYAECGGLMYLAGEIIDLTGKHLPMAGLVPGAVTMTRNLQNFGYCLAETNESEAPYHGHEFHCSRWEREEECSNRWQVRRRRGGPGRSEGYQAHRLHASYVHLFWKQSPGLLSHFLSDAEEARP